jgi:hypothetical protein
VTAQFTKKLFQIRQRYLLTLTDGRKRHGPTVLAQAKVNHCCDRESAFGRESHNKLLKVGLTVVVTFENNVSKENFSPSRPIQLDRIRTSLLLLV